MAIVFEPIRFFKNEQTNKIGGLYRPSGRSISFHYPLLIFTLIDQFPDVVVVRKLETQSKTNLGVVVFAQKCSLSTPFFSFIFFYILVSY